MSRFSRLVLLAAVAAVFVAAAPASAPAAGDGPTATASKSCSVGDSRSYNTTYVIWIRARRISCRKAKALVRKFHSCRKAGPKGARGRCRSPGAWRCRENRTAGVGSYDSVARCRKGRKRVRHQYTQWT
jgi:hypothetical protein